MRVLALCDYYDRDSVGGAERVAHEVYTRLVRDHDLEITVVGAVPELPDCRAGVAVSDDTGVRVVRVPGRDLTSLLGAQLMWGKGTRRLAGRELDRLRPDVIHVNGLHFHSSAVGVRLARERSLPLITTAHLAEVRGMPGRLSVAATAFDRLAGRRVIRASDRTLAVGRSVLQHVVSLGAKPDSVTLAYNGVDHARFHPQGRDLETPWLRAILVGRLIGNKGTLHALEAVAMARRLGRDVRLTVVGDGPLDAAVRRRAGQPDLVGVVDVVGRVRDVEAWLRRADVALRPSYTEGLPLAVLEALASGTPVICTDVPGNLEAVTHGHNGLVVPVGDTEALTQALCRLYDNREELRRMAQHAVIGSLGFTWEAAASAHLHAMQAAADCTTKGTTS